MINVRRTILSSALLSIILLYSCNDEKLKEAPNDIGDYAIVYNVLADSENDNYEVFTMNTDGTNKKNFTNLKGVEWSYTSSGNKIYFYSDKDTTHRIYFLYESDYRGNNIRKVSNIRLADSWMSFRKNGTEIIVDPHPSVDSVFYIIDLQGKIVQKIFTGLPYSHDPTFINDGEQIAFRGAHKKSKREKGFRDEIYIINVDGTGLKQLTSYPESDSTAPWYAYKAGPPRQHPTEKFISYASFQNGKYSLFGVTIDGKKQWKLTNNDLMEIYHDWSPDGNWLVTDLADLEEKHFNIGLINWKTKELKILTDSSYQYQQSPNFVLKD